MGCGASSVRPRRSKEREPVLEPQPPGSGRGTARSHRPGVAQAAPPPKTEEEHRLEKALAQLGLEEFLPKLDALGARTVPDVTELLVSDLEEIGLTRVQVRQLQRCLTAEPDARQGDSGLQTKVCPGSEKRADGPAEGPADRAAGAGAADRTGPAEPPGVGPAQDGPSMLQPEEEPLQAAAVPERMPRQMEDQALQGQPAAAVPERVPRQMENQALQGVDPPGQQQEHDPQTQTQQPFTPQTQHLTSTVPFSDTSLTSDNAAASEAAGTLYGTIEISGPEPPASVEETLLPPTMQETLLPDEYQARVQKGPAVEAVQVHVMPRAPPLPRPEAPKSQSKANGAVLSEHASHDLPPEELRHDGPACKPVPRSGSSRLLQAGAGSGRDSNGASDDSLPKNSINKLLTEQVSMSEVPAVKNAMPEALRRRLEERGEKRAVAKPRDSKEDLGQGPQPCLDPGRKDVLRAPEQRGGLPAASSAGPRKRFPSADSSPAGARPSPSPRKKSSLARHDTGPAAGEGGERCERQMFDKNELRANNVEVFKRGIVRYQQEVLCLRARSPELVDVPDLSDCTLRLSDQAVRVYLRKRPLFQAERQRGDYDILSVIPGEPMPTQVVLHNCNFQADLKTPQISHVYFEFDHVFGEGVENHEVYRMAASDLVTTSRGGGIGTMFMFGQTGSGKTYTMRAIEDMAARDLFEGSTAEPCLSVQFVELQGNRCLDLLAHSPQGAKGGGGRPELRIREQGDGLYVAEGAVSRFPKTPAELSSVIRLAHSRRATSSTEANATSSRSHAICMLRLLQSGGELTLADCAGTERRKDSAHHSKERQQEGAEINASLHALKECIRHATTQKSVPSHVLRASALTKLLAGAFAHADQAKLAVVCTASPCASDTEHTVTTMRTGAALGGRFNEVEEKEVLGGLPRELAPGGRGPAGGTHPKQWTPEQVREWLAEAGGGKCRCALDALPSNFTGQMLVRVTEKRCIQLCGNDRRGQLLYTLLHQEIRRANDANKPAH